MVWIETLQLMWSIDLIEDVVHAIERAYCYYFLLYYPAYFS